MDRGTQDAERLFGSEVLDADGNKIGTVDNVWVDDATDAPEFVGVKTGMLMGKTHLIPVAQARVDSAGGTITVPYPESQVKDAPSFGADDQLSPQDEDEVYRHYGVDRSTGRSPSGLPAGERAGIDEGADPGTRDYGAADTGERGMELAEETLQVGKRSVEAGRVRLRKVVRTERREVPVELRREEVNVERVSASGTDVPSDAFQEREIDVPVMREEPVVDKQARVTGQVRVDKTTETETRTVGGEVRSEDVEVDDTDLRGRGER